MSLSGASPDLKKDALARIQRDYPSAEAIRCSGDVDDRNFGARVIFVEYVINGRPEKAVVYYRSGHVDTVEVFASEEAFIRDFVRRTHPLGVGFRDFISALVAVVIVIIIGYMAVTGQSGNIPQALTAALGVIIGFYFRGLSNHT